MVEYVCNFSYVGGWGRRMVWIEIALLYFSLGDRARFFFKKKIIKIKIFTLFNSLKKYFKLFSILYNINYKFIIKNFYNLKYVSYILILLKILIIKKY